jgi:uncharacterized protein involved in type VI secretion and phage assembly
MPITPLKKRPKTIKGLCSGIVTGLVDNAGEFRVKIKLAGIDDKGGDLFARLATLDAGNNRGSFFMPEIDDEVIVGFINDDARQPIVLGSLFSSKNATPLNPEDANPEKGYVSRSKIKILIDDSKKVITIETPDGKFFSMNEDENKIILNDILGNKIIMDPDGITIESAKAITLKAGAMLTIASPQLSIKADTALKIESSGGCSITSSGITDIKGSIININ